MNRRKATRKCERCGGPYTTYPCGQSRCVPCTDARRRDRTYEPGHRDLECPICGARWFALLGNHLSHVHGIYAAEARRRGYRTASESVIHNQIALNEERSSEGLRRYVAERRAQDNQRFLRWARDAEIALTRNPASACVDLARKWKVSHGLARDRVLKLRARGLLADRSSFMWPARAKAIKAERKRGIRGANRRLADRWGVSYETVKDWTWEVRKRGLI